MQYLPVNTLTLSNVGDYVYWGLNKSAKYTTKAMYKWLEGPNAGCSFKWVWSGKMCLKNQIFLWQMFQNAILTRQVIDNPQV